MFDCSRASALLTIFVLVFAPVLVCADMRAANRAFEAGSYKSAFKLLLPLAEAGEMQAQAHLAWLFLNGAGTEQNDEKAVQWYLKAAEQGDAYAQFNYAEMCIEGRGTGQSDEKAFIWYQKAARQGQVNAQFALGEMYLDGAGVEPDPVKAYAWIHVVVGSGIDAAETLLEEMEFDLSEEQLKEARLLGQSLWSRFAIKDEE
ncbi:MAG: sel1 repeat family protein [Gammaproteobacteria bacterium]|nr:sel1 repeat family protein [Gammaproteobacteria bacterium]